MAAFLSGLLPSGTTMVTLTPTAVPAKARLWPWLPRVAEMIPLTWGRPARSRSAQMTPPLTLNAPVGVWFSCLTHTSAPTASASSGQGYWGVGGTRRLTTSVAQASCSESNCIPVSVGPPGRASSRHSQCGIPKRERHLHSVGRPWRSEWNADRMHDGCAGFSGIRCGHNVAAAGPVAGPRLSQRGGATRSWRRVRSDQHDENANRGTGWDSGLGPARSGRDGPPSKPLDHRAVMTRNPQYFWYTVENLSGRAR